MSWNDVGASEYIVRIYCADEEMKVINVGRNFSYTIPLLGKNYWAGVSAKNSAGESPLSNLVEMIPNAYNLLGKAQNLGEHFYAQIGFSNNTYLVNVNNNAQLGNINSSNQAIYEFTRTANEAYTIKDMKTGLYLDVYQAASKVLRICSSIHTILDLRSASSYGNLMMATHYNQNVLLIWQ